MAAIKAPKTEGKKVIVRRSTEELAKIAKEKYELLAKKELDEKFKSKLYTLNLKELMPSILDSATKKPIENVTFEVLFDLLAKGFKTDKVTILQAVGFAAGIKRLNPITQKPIAK
jgi:hypothetical protein